MLLPRFSIVIPLLNEAKSLEQLCVEINQMALRNNYQAQVIFIDDGSTDDSWVVIKKLAANYQHVEGVRLRRNFGKAIALKNGLARADGDIIVTLDADLQHDPADIPRLTRKLQDGYDLVNGWQKDRCDAPTKLVYSKLFNKFTRIFTGMKLHDVNCGMKCFRSALNMHLHLINGSHRFIPWQAHVLGFRVTEEPIASRPRLYGKSKYGPTRVLMFPFEAVVIWWLLATRRQPLPISEDRYVLERITNDHSQ